MSRKKDYRELLKTPFNTEIKNIQQVAQYFLYYAPSIDSAHSSVILSDERSEVILAMMLKKTGMNNTSRFLKKIQPASWRKDDLHEYELDFEKSRMLCDKYSKENDLHALLRHIRNAMAHGYVYVWKKKRKGQFVFLIDFDSRKNKPSAKIMISMAILEQWKSILEKELL